MKRWILFMGVGVIVLLALFFVGEEPLIDTVVSLFEQEEISETQSLGVENRETIEAGALEQKKRSMGGGGAGGGAGGEGGAGGGDPIAAQETVPEDEPVPLTGDHICKCRRCKTIPSACELVGGGTWSSVLPNPETCENCGESVWRTVSASESCEDVCGEVESSGSFEGLGPDDVEIALCESRADEICTVFITQQAEKLALEEEELTGEAEIGTQTTWIEVE